MMLMLIQRLKQPDNDIDVYIRVSIFAITQHKSSSRVQIKGKHILSSHKQLYRRVVRTKHTKPQVLLTFQWYLDAIDRTIIVQIKKYISHWNTIMDTCLHSFYLDMCREKKFHATILTCQEKSMERSFSDFFISPNILCMQYILNTRK